ncbi:hypothetical protein [Paenibacillus faecis]|uniref:hypothetical protein n=1 Tax=Paenibacillus faecis TaxID=862114 RepID=UPI001B86B792|nr:hypothetical protein [Paenibacillus faecis]
MSNLNAGNWDSGNMFGWLEESLNYVNRVYLPDPQGEGFQLDLLIPVKENLKTIPKLRCVTLKTLIKQI